MRKQAAWPALAQGWLRERGTRTKLLVTVGGLCAVIALVGYLGLRTVQDMETSLVYFGQILVPSNVAAVAAREGLRNARQQAALAGDSLTLEADLPRLRSQFNRYMGDSRRALATYAELPLSDAERWLLPDYRDAEEAYIAATDAVWTATDSNRKEAQTRYQTRAEPQASRMEKVISDLVVLQGQRSSDAASAAQVAYEVALNLLLGAIVGGTLGALALGIVVARSVASPREEAALAHQALHDGLTNLPNRALLYDRVRSSIAAAKRDSTSFTLLLVDLDHFKDVNDTLGHHAGDQLLQELAGRLRATVRAGDTVARLGGDEFAALLPGAGGDTGTRVARTVIDVLQRPVTLEGQEVAVGASVGIAVYPDHGEDPETLLRRADVAMYRAKQTRGCSAVYEVDQDHESSDRLTLVSGLRRAIHGGELVLHYQPKINCQSGRMVGVEALVRWQHPTRGLVLPDEFIGQAEQSNLIGSLTRWVLNAALQQCAAWQKLGLDVPIAVNLSARDVQDRELPSVVRQVLERWAIAPNWLKLEITESALVMDRDGATEVIDELAAAGVQMAIDDFGTGYASLANLKHLPIREVKIDRSFVRGLSTDAADLAIVRSTIELGHELGLRTVAEGVEDGATLERLTALGCDEAQGYFIAEPMAAADLVSWHAASGRPGPGWLAAA